MLEGGVYRLTGNETAPVVYATVIKNSIYCIFS